MFAVAADLLGLVVFLPSIAFFAFLLWVKRPTILASLAGLPALFSRISAAPTTPTATATTSAESEAKIKRLEAKLEAALRQKSDLIELYESLEVGRGRAWQEFSRVQQELAAATKKIDGLRKEVRHWEHQASTIHHSSSPAPAPSPLLPPPVAAATTCPSTRKTKTLETKIVDQKSTIESLESTVNERDLEIKKLQTDIKRVESSKTSLRKSFEGSYNRVKQAVKKEVEQCGRSAGIH